MNQESIVELHFPIQGSDFPSDHAYGLYSAISRIAPESHQADWLGIHTIHGRSIGDKKIKLGRFAKLRLRLPISRAAELCKLSGSELEVHGSKIKCGIPQIIPLRPGKDLRSRLVLIKLCGSEGSSAEADSFLKAVLKKIKLMEITGDVYLERELVCPEKDQFARRVVRVKNTVLTGYGVIIRNLSEADSMRLQIQGIGGKRRMGCGLFVPLKECE